MISLVAPKEIFDSFYLPRPLAESSVFSRNDFRPPVDGLPAN
jgi:hypothetical protein